MSDQPSKTPAPVPAGDAADTDLPMMAQTGASVIDLNSDPNAEVVAVDKSKPADFKDDDDDDADADAVAAALEEGQYGDDDIIPVEGDALDVAGDDAAADEEGEVDGDADADAGVPDLAASLYTGHKDAVYTVAVSPVNSALIASGAGDDSAHLIDISDPAAPVLLLELAGLSDSVSSVAFSPDGALLAVGVMDGTVHIVDVDARAVLHELSVDGDLECMSWHPAPPAAVGPTLATGNSEGLVLLWDVINGYVRKVLSSPRREPVRTVFFPAGAPLLLVTGGDNGHTTLWDCDKARSLAVLKSAQDTHEGGVICLAQHPTQPLIITAGQDGSVHIAQMTTTPGKLTVLIRLKDAHRDSVEALAFGGLPGAPLLATASTDCTVKVWDATRNWQLRQTLQHEGGVVALSWVPGLPILVTASADGAVRAWDGRDGQLLALLTGHNSAIMAMGASAGSAASFRVATGADDNTVRVFDLAAVVQKIKTAAPVAAKGAAAK